MGHSLGHLREDSSSLVSLNPEVFEIIWGYLPPKSRNALYRSSKSVQALLSTATGQSSIQWQLESHCVGSELVYVPQLPIGFHPSTAVSFERRAAHTWSCQQPNSKHVTEGTCEHGEGSLWQAWLCDVPCPHAGPPWLWGVHRPGVCHMLMKRHTHSSSTQATLAEKK